MAVTTLVTDTARRTATHTRLRVQRLGFALGFPGLLAVAVIILNAFVTQALEMVFDTGTEVLAGILGTTVVIALVAGRWAAHLPSLRHTTYGDPGTVKVPARRGVVIVAGLDSADPGSPAATLLTQATGLEYLAIVGTPESADRGVHRDLVTRLAPAAGHRLPPAHVRLWEYGNAESVSDAEQATSEALTWLIGRGLDPAEIVVDVSAGRRPMVFGAKDAADELLVETQYLAQRWDPVTNQPVAGTSMFKVIKTFHTDLS